MNNNLLKIKLETSETVVRVRSEWFQNSANNFMDHAESLVVMFPFTFPIGRGTGNLSFLQTERIVQHLSIFPNYEFRCVRSSLSSRFKTNGNILDQYVGDKDLFKD